MFSDSLDKVFLSFEGKPLASFDNLCARVDKAMNGVFCLRTDVEKR